MRDELAGPKLEREEAAFLPAALSLQVTPVHPAPRRFALAICALFSIALIWACFGQIDIIATAPGRIVVSDGSKSVQPLETSVVKAIYVKDGDHVDAGQALIDLDATDSRADGKRASSDRLAAISEMLRTKALLSDVYHADSTVRFGGFEASGQVFAEAFAPAQLGGPTTLHRTQQMWVDVSGDSARAETYAFDYIQVPDADGEMKRRIICGRYLDRLEKRAGEWRVSERTYVADTNVNWPEAQTIQPLGPMSEHVAVGSQGRRDAGIALLALANARNLAAKSGDSGVSQHVSDQNLINSVVARQQISDLTMAYCRGVDRADEALLKSIFHPDAVMNAGAFVGNAQDYAREITAMVQKTFVQTFHSIANQWIDVQGDHAIGETYLVAVNTLKNSDGSLSEVLAGGRFIDRFDKRDGKWKIAERSFVLDWNITQPSTRVVKEGLYETLTLQGQYGQGDPVYTLWK
jgi:hypothetical protein